MNLGPVPAEKLLEKIEQQLGIPVLNVEMDDHRDISGVTVHLPDFTCILINRNEPAVRRAFDLAHELFHALTWEAMPPGVVESNALDWRGSGKKMNRVEQGVLHAGTPNDFEGGITEALNDSANVAPGELTSNDD